MNKKYMLLYI